MNKVYRPKQDNYTFINVYGIGFNPMLSSKYDEFECIHLFILTNIPHIALPVPQCLMYIWKYLTRCLLN